MEFGCIPLELISNLGMEKHWKAKLKSLAEIDIILDNQINVQLMIPHCIGFSNLLVKLIRDTNNNVVHSSLALFKKLFTRDKAILSKLNIDDMVPMLI